MWINVNFYFCGKFTDLINLFKKKRHNRFVFVITRPFFIQITFTLAHFKGLIKIYKKRYYHFFRKTSPSYVI